MIGNDVTERVHFDLIVVAASAGGLAALIRLLGSLPTLPVAIAVVQHLLPTHPSLIADILRRRTGLDIREAKEGDVLRPGVVFTAPPDRHLVIEADHRLSLSTAEAVHFVRPSADLLFESAARVFGERAIAVVLSGTGRDGACGVQAVKAAGGWVIAQSEQSAEFYGMPGAAIDTGVVDAVLPVEAIASALVILVTEGRARS